MILNCKPNLTTPSLAKSIGRTERVHTTQWRIIQTTLFRWAYVICLRWSIWLGIRILNPSASWSSWGHGKVARLLQPGEQQLHKPPGEAAEKYAGHYRTTSTTEVWGIQSSANLWHVCDMSHSHPHSSWICTILWTRNIMNIRNWMKLPLACDLVYSCNML